MLQDTNLNVPDAVLVVFLEGRALVLDNQVNGIVAAASIHHYHPYYSINEDGWWLTAARRIAPRRIFAEDPLQGPA